MRRAGGYAIWVDPDRPTIERDTFTCCHCNSVVHVVPGQDPTLENGFCMKCMKHTCRACADKPDCVPYEKQMEALERDITNRVNRDRALERALRGNS